MLQAQVLAHAPEDGHDAVVGRADEGGHGQLLGLVAGLLACHQDLGGGGGLGPGEDAVVLDHEVVAQGHQEQDADAAAQEAHDDHLPQRGHGYAAARRVGQDVEGGDGEGRAAHHVAAVGADALDDDVFQDGVLAGEEAGQAHGQDGDGDGGLDALAQLQGQVGGGHAEDGAEDEPHDDGPGRGLWHVVLGHQRDIGLPRLQRPPRIKGQALDLLRFRSVGHHRLLKCWHSDEKNARRGTQRRQSPQR